MAIYMTFPILKEQTDGSVVFDKDVDTANLVLQKDGVDVSPAATFINNGDGTYRVDISTYGSGSYSVKLNGVVQDELSNIYKVTDDNLTEQNLVSAATKGYVRKDPSGDLYIYTDGSNAILHGGDIVDDLTTGGTTKVLSAEQGKTLKTLVDGKEDADSTILKEGDIVDNLTSTSATAPLSANQGRVLDERIDAIAVSSNIVRYRTLYSDAQVAAAANDSAAGSYTEWVQDDTQTTKIKIPCYKQSGDRSVILNCEIKAAGDGGDVQVDVTGSTTVTASKSTTSGTYEQVSVTVDVSGLSDGSYDVEIKLQNNTVPNTGELTTMRRPEILVKSY
ncbi:MAG: hypothetical protein D6800_11035 [Candidatus Zixiibacteriota bacterium]|nr:MAG: hypothetical protein D6800_11035 [candidate division Zixibacteria bacterium]